MCAALTRSTSQRSSPRPSTAAACSRSRVSLNGGGYAYAGGPSHGRAFAAVAELLAAKWAALIPVADRIGRKFRLCRERGGAVLLGAALWAIAEAEGRAVIPPTARVVGDAVEYLVANLRVLEADANELQEILRRNPDRAPPPVDRHIAEIADTDAGDAQSVFERIQRRDRLAECLADAVPAVGTQRSIDSYAPLARVKADHMIRGCEHPPLDAVTTRRLEQVIATDDIG